MILSPLLVVACGILFRILNRPGLPVGEDNGDDCIFLLEGDLNDFPLFPDMDN